MDRVIDRYQSTQLRIYTMHKTAIPKNNTLNIEKKLPTSSPSHEKKPPLLNHKKAKNQETIFQKQSKYRGNLAKQI